MSPRLSPIAFCTLCLLLHAALAVSMPLGTVHHDRLAPVLPFAHPRRQRGIEVIGMCREPAGELGDEGRGRPELTSLGECQDFFRGTQHGRMFVHVAFTRRETAVAHPTILGLEVFLQVGVDIAQ